MEKLQRRFYRVRRVGPSVSLISLGDAAADMGVKEATLEDTLSGLHVPVVEIEGVAHFNLYSLERALFVALLPGKSCWRFGWDKEATFTEKESMEMEMAAVMYGSVTAKTLERRLRDMAKAVKKEVKRKKGLDKVG